MITRRLFLTVAAALPFLCGHFIRLPVLWGDGVHDDTDALQAILDGRAVWDARDEMVKTRIVGGSYRVSRTLVASGEYEGPPRIQNASIRGSVRRGDWPLLRIGR